jgi:hypothetical protein
VAGLQQLHPETKTARRIMKTYFVLFAEDVPHYGMAHIRAKNDVAALETARTYPLSEVTNDAEWENSACKRIVYIQDAEGTLRESPVESRGTKR